MAGVQAHPGLAHLPRAGALPTPRQLAGLGTVLCLYRALNGSELAGWQQAVRVEVRTGVDSDGLNESLLFFDAQDRCCWRLCLLPDSDFVAWDRLLASLPAGHDEAGESLGERLWRRLAGRLLGGQWRACALRLHAVPQATGAPVLAASLSPTSSLGTATARRIASAEGAEADRSLEDCCCAQAALAAVAPKSEKGAGDDVIPLVRLK